MSQRRAVIIITAIVTLIFFALTYLLQRYRLAALEEMYIFVYDGEYNSQLSSVPGGAAQLVASWVSQFMLFPIWGAMLLTVIYGVALFALAMVGMRRAMPIWTLALAYLPCVCLMLCLENNYYKLQGHAALMLCCLAVWAYDAITDKLGQNSRTMIGVLLCVAIYSMAGSAGLWVAGALAVSDIIVRGLRSWPSVAYPLVTLALAWVCYDVGIVVTLRQAFTPGLYYEWDMTYMMYLYALTAMVIYVVAVAVCRRIGLKCATIGWRRWAYAGVAMLVVAVAATALFRLTRNPVNYRSAEQRYHARNGEWDAIAAMDYGDETTAYTSYRVLALAQKGELIERLNEIHPYIYYYFENKPLVKKMDQQVLSDIYYACDYMGAARHSAFDTNIVTPGRFNPYETQKLVDINIAYGDYAVAEKLIGQLEKTLFYADRATERRRYLGNDSLVEAHPELGRMRRAIPVENNYMTREGTFRDLRAIIQTNPDQKVAKQLYDAYLILTNKHE